MLRQSRKLRFLAGLILFAVGCGVVLPHSLASTIWISEDNLPTAELIEIAHSRDRMFTIGFSMVAVASALFASVPRPTSFRWLSAGEVVIGTLALGFFLAFVVLVAGEYQWMQLSHSWRL
jgi:hypothetical protein